MERSRHSLKHLILAVALATVTAAGAAAPLVRAAASDPVTIHHFSRHGAMAIHLLINPQPLPPGRIPPCLPCF